MAKLTKDELIEAFKEMTLIELSEFVKEFEDVFDVEAAAPVAVAAGAPAAAAAEEEKTEFDVVLTDAGAKKIGVIKAVRELVSGLGLKEAKEKVDSAPQTIKEAAQEAEANEIKEKLEAEGAKVTLK